MFAAFGTRIDLIWHFSHCGVVREYLLLFYISSFGWRKVSEIFQRKRLCLLRRPLLGTFGWDIWVGHLGGSFGWDIWVGHFWGEHWDQHEISWNLKQIWFVRYVIVRILPPFGSYAPVSPSLVPVNRLAYHFSVSFFSFLRYSSFRPWGEAHWSAQTCFPLTWRLLGGRAKSDR